MGLLGAGSNTVGATAVAWAQPGNPTCPIPLAMCSKVTTPDTCATRRRRIRSPACASASGTAVASDRGRRHHRQLQLGRLLRRRWRVAGSPGRPRRLHRARESDRSRGPRRCEDRRAGSVGRDVLEHALRPVQETAQATRGPKIGAIPTRPATRTRSSTGPSGATRSTTTARSRQRECAVRNLDAAGQPGHRAERQQLVPREHASRARARRKPTGG